MDPTAPLRSVETVAKVVSHSVASTSEYLASFYERSAEIEADQQT